jgi:hypothetical protein
MGPGYRDGRRDREIGGVRNADTDTIDPQVPRDALDFSRK